MMTSNATSGHRYLQWDIWQVRWQHEDGTHKDRPALLISPDAFNEANEQLWFTKISGQPHVVTHRFDLEPGDPAYAGTGLKKKSYFYYVLVQQIPKPRVLYWRGRLNRLTAQLLDYQIRKAIEHILPWRQHLPDR